MKIVRPLLALAVGGSLVLAGSAGAATPKTKVLMVTDPKGDANAINGGGLVYSDNGSPVPFDNTVTPVGSQDNKDVVSAKWAPVIKKVGKKSTCTGFTVAITFVAAPASGTNYRTLGKGTVNTVQWSLNYNGTTTTIRYSSGTSATVELSSPAVVSGKTITWTVQEKDIKATGESLKAFVLTGPGIDIRTYTPTPAVTLTAPLWDQIAPKKGQTFKAC